MGNGWKNYTPEERAARIERLRALIRDPAFRKKKVRASRKAARKRLGWKTLYGPDGKRYRYQSATEFVERHAGFFDEADLVPGADGMTNAVMGLDHVGRRFRTTWKGWSHLSPARLAVAKRKLAKVKLKIIREAPKHVTPEGRRRCTQLLMEMRPAAIQLAKAAVRASPLTGSFETNLRAKRWRLRDPDNRVWECKNLSLFVKTHRHLFPEGDTLYNIYAGLSHLRPDRKHPVGTWKGWRWVSEMERRVGNQDLLAGSPVFKRRKKG